MTAVKESPPATTTTPKWLRLRPHNLRAMFYGALSWTKRLFRFRRCFAELLDWHLSRGTRPTGSPESPRTQWTNKEFGFQVGVNERTVRNWRAGRTTPPEIASIERELFGENPVYNFWREELREAHRAVQIDKPNSAIAKESGDPNRPVSTEASTDKQIHPQTSRFHRIISDLLLHLGVADVPTGRWTLAAGLNLIATICTVSGPLAGLALAGLYVSISVFAVSFAGIAFRTRYRHRCNFPCVAATFFAFSFGLVLGLQWLT
jgi:hypothetical protein